MKYYEIMNTHYPDLEWEWPKPHYSGPSETILSHKFPVVYSEADLSWLWKLQGDILGSQEY